MKNMLLLVVLFTSLFLTGCVTQLGYETAGDSYNCPILCYAEGLVASVGAILNVVRICP